MSATRGPFTILRDLSSPEEIIRGDNFLELSKTAQNIVYCKRDFVLKSGKWREHFQPSLVSRHPNLRGKVLILGHSDLKTSKLYSKMLVRSLGLKALFGTNTAPSRENSRSLPLGITNHTHETPLHPILGNENHFFDADLESNFPPGFRPRLYANFTSQNNAASRKRLTDSLKSLPRTIQVTYDRPEFTHKGRVRFLAMCRETNFVLCPEGNGIDTHRLWETLYMGGVPVVKRNPYINDLTSALPVVQVNSWTDIGRPDFLEREWFRVQSLVWDKALLLQSYWSQVIQATADEH